MAAPAQPKGYNVYRVAYVSPDQLGEIVRGYGPSNPGPYRSPLPVHHMVWTGATIDPEGDSAEVAARVFDQLGIHDRTSPAFDLLPLAAWAVQHGAPEAFISEDDDPEEDDDTE